MFNDFPERQAICAFFLDFVLLPRHPDSVRGHLEHLYPLYQKTSPDSPLSLATSSVALLISGNSQRRAADQQLGRTTFGRALQKISTAIRDPVESIKDETLMAVLLLGLYEVRCLRSRARVSQASRFSPLFLRHPSKVPHEHTGIEWHPMTFPKELHATQ